MKDMDYFPEKYWQIDVEKLKPCPSSSYMREYFDK